MNPDELLDRMLKFAETCNEDDKIKVINGAYKTWADSLPDPYGYDIVKNEYIKPDDKVRIIKENEIKKTDHLFRKKIRNSLKKRKKK